MTIPMSEISTTKMTSKGQVVIPEEIREYMHLESGVKFIVMATGDSIIFKKITPIPQKDVKHLLKASREIDKKYKFNEKEIPDIISEVRKSKG
jgi:AbrB family looped-hinge helix DNA binding protein